MKETATRMRTEIKDKNSIISTARTEMLKKVGIVAGIAMIAFLLGFLPMWLSARGYEKERDQARVQLRQSLLQNDLATSAINSRRGEFEQARRQASDFYTALRAEFDADQSFFKTSEQRKTIQTILDWRDETITLLARNESSAADRLTDTYLAFMQANSAATQTDSQK